MRSEENLAQNLNVLQECDNLSGTIEEIRDQNDTDIQMIRNETEAAYKKKMSELQTVLNEKALALRIVTKCLEI